MIKRGSSEISLYIDHHEVELLQEVIVLINWVYVPEILPSLDNDYGEPYDFTYDVDILSAPSWVTLDMVEEALNEMSIFDIMNS